MSAHIVCATFAKNLTGGATMAPPLHNGCAMPLVAWQHFRSVHSQRSHGWQFDLPEPQRVSSIDARHDRSLLRIHNVREEPDRGRPMTPPSRARNAMPIEARHCAQSRADVTAAGQAERSAAYPLWLRKPQAYTYAWAGGLVPAREHAWPRQATRNGDTACTRRERRVPHPCGPFRDPGGLLAHTVAATLRTVLSQHPIFCK